MTTVTIETYGIADEPDRGPGFGLLLAIGIGWIFLSFFVLQFSWASITAISILVGVVLVVAAASEIAWALLPGGWRWLHAVVGIVFVLGAIAAFLYPGQTFGTLALIFGWYLLIKGTYDIVVALMDHGVHLWWIGLLAGLAQIALAFWVVGYPGRSAALLVLWVGLGALLRGITTVIAAFQVRSETAGSYR
jgi:uncharacterized membrane protein HdeD (DUF308 family)